jgi:hypothetical protein
VGIERLKINAYESDTFSKSKLVDSFEVMLNPESYSRTFKIKQNASEGIGKSGADIKFESYAPETITLDFIIDGTGVIDSQKDQSVSDQIKKFNDLTFKYNGNIHRNNFLSLNWGDLTFLCVLKQYSIKYTLFDPEGKPLRATLSATFDEHTSPKMESAESERESPDLTHVRIVREGDTLPGLCEKIYNEPGHYLKVAKFNRMGSFRRLTVGSEIYFPQLR